MSSKKMKTFPSLVMVHVLFVMSANASFGMMSIEKADQIGSVTRFETKMLLPMRWNLLTCG